MLRIAVLILFCWSVFSPATVPASLAQAPASVTTAPAKPLPKLTERGFSKAEFGRLAATLSEPGGYFDSDNLISNEASYLHVLGKMRELQVTGGAYLGVGPDQSFSYIAQVRPRIAFIIDIRRDNVLQHLLFKAMFAEAENRLEYLCLLFGKPKPKDLKRWQDKTIDLLIAYLEQTPAQRDLFEKTHLELQAKAKNFGIPLAAKDLEYIRRIHTDFFTAGLEIRYSSHRRPSRAFYPTYRDLIQEKDLSGRQANYLAGEETFQWLKTMQKKNLIVPVVGNLAGDYALGAIGRYLAEQGERISAFYVSNVEFYLMRDGSFPRFAETVKQLPRDERSVIIRSDFVYPYRGMHPQALPGYMSVQLLQTIESFVKTMGQGGYQSYAELVTKDVLDLR